MAKSHGISCSELDHSFSIGSPRVDAGLSLSSSDQRTAQ